MTTSPHAVSGRRAARAARLAAAAVAASALFVVPLAGASGAVPAGAVPSGAVVSGAVVSAPTGWLRVAHLAPTVPAMDIYLDSLAGAKQIVLRRTVYGTFTPYQTLQPGTYALAMRTSGSSAMSAPAASYQVTVKAGTAYTVAALGTPGHISTELFDDALVRPPAGQARVRLIQGAPAAAAVSVTAVGGPLLAQNVPYGAVTGYADVPQGRWTLKVTEDGKGVATTVDVAAGGVYSLVVVQRKDGGLTLNTGVDVSGKPLAAVGKDGKPVSMSVKMDAADSHTAPQGSVNTGEGGTAPGRAGFGPGSGASAADDLGAGLTGAAGIALAAGLMRRRRVAAGR